MLKVHKRVGSIIKSSFVNKDESFDKIQTHEKDKFIQFLINLKREIQFDYMSPERISENWKIVLKQTGGKLPKDFTDQICKFNRNLLDIQSQSNGDFHVYLRYYDPVSKYSNKRYDTTIIAIIFLIIFCLTLLYVINPNLNFNKFF